METKKIFIYLDGKPKPPMDLQLEKNLNEIRVKIKEKLSNNFLFLTGNDEIQIKDETDWKLEDIIISKDGKILLNIKTKINQNVTDDFTAPVHRQSMNVKEFVNSLNKNQDESEKKIEPIKGSTFLYKKKKVKMILKRKEKTILN